MFMFIFHLLIYLLFYFVYSNFLNLMLLKLLNFFKFHNPLQMISFQRDSKALWKHTFLQKCLKTQVL